MSLDFLIFFCLGRYKVISHCGLNLPFPVIGICVSFLHFGYLFFEYTWTKIFSNFFFFSFIYFLKFIYFCLRWVFVAEQGLSLVAASRGYSSLRCMGFSLWWLLLLQSMGSRHVGSVVVAHGLSCSTACGVFPDWGSNLCPLPWQVDF